MQTFCYSTLSLICCMRMHRKHLFFYGWINIGSSVAAVWECHLINMSRTVLGCRDL